VKSEDITQPQFWLCNAKPHF